MPTFSSKHPCSCGLTFNDHETVFESREERAAEGREVDPKWMQDNNMIGGTGGITSFTGLVEGGDVDKFRDPNSIMENVQGSIGGYQALNAIEGEESKDGYGGGVVAKTGGKAKGKTAYELFCTPHNYGSKMKAIGGVSKPSKRVSSYKYR